MLEGFIYLFAGTLSPRPKSDRKLLTRLQGIISGTLVERAQCRQEMREVQDAQPKSLGWNHSSVTQNNLCVTLDNLGHVTYPLCVPIFSSVKMKTMTDTSWGCNTH